MKIGLLGGSFDPVHDGHLKLADAALRELHLDKVYLVLTPLSPFKKNQPLTPVSHRLKMLEAAVNGKKNLAVGPWELTKKGPVYTVQTLTDYKARHPNDSLYFIMGSDAWNGFSKWKNPERIASLAHLVIGRRPGHKKIVIPLKFRLGTHVLRGVFPELSSTEIRLSPYRYRHSLAVADLAAQLARKNGWDPWKAYQAGLFHDCAKEWSPRKLISYAKKYRLSVPHLDFMVAHAPGLLHAYVGAHWARQKKWVTDAPSLKAIASHTLGSARMTTPEKILYVADFASKDRMFKSAAAIRSAALKNLETGFRLALAKKIEFNLIRRKPLHPKSCSVWNEHAS